MARTFMVWFSVLAALAAACDPAGSGSDNDALPGQGPGGGDDAGSAQRPDSSGSTDPSPPDEDASQQPPAGDGGGADPGTEPDGGATDPSDAGPPPTTRPVEGSADGCTSYGAPQGEQCAGYYCNVSAADIAAAVAPLAGPCSDLDPALICAGTVSTKVGECARSVKLANLAANAETLRRKTQECVYGDATIKASVSEQCLGCYLDSAQCAGDKCAGACLAGNSARCDQCRLDNECTQPVYDCGGLPNPL